MASHTIRLDGVPVKFTCTIGRHRTDIDAGHAHGNGQARGSVLEGALVQRGPLSLWLEHVVDSKTNMRGYWLMWYRSGKPAVSMTPMLDADELAQLGTTLIRVGASNELVDQDGR